MRLCVDYLGRGGGVQSLQLQFNLYNYNLYNLNNLKLKVHHN